MGEKIRSFRDLKVWQKGKELVKIIYTVVSGFPKNEQYGLSSQLKRASVSVVANIAEGCGRNNIQEYIQFLGISLGSLAELETEMELAQDIGFLQGMEKSAEKVFGLVNEIRPMLLVLKRNLGLIRDTR